MAIKTTGTESGLRVLTKTVDGEVRVSCSCCEEAACCMYPAQGLFDELYTWDDLPDELDGPDGQIWTKRPEPENIDQAVVYQSAIYDGEESISLGDGGGFWSALAGTESNQCLSDPAWGFTDRFEDTYMASCDFYLNGSFDSSFGPVEIERLDLCTWQGSSGDFGPLFVRYNPATHKWNYSWRDPGILNSPKNASQSAPNADGGTYEDKASGSVEVRNFVVT